MLYKQYMPFGVSILVIALILVGCDNGSTILEAPPESRIIEITSPPDRTMIMDCDTVLFEGLILWRNEDSTLVRDSATWSSDCDGVLGRGKSITAGGLSINTHRITFSIDEGGRATSDEVILFVGETPPEYELVAIPGTSGYLMGYQISLNDDPVHIVSLSPFHMGKYEVSYRLWRAVRIWGEANGYFFAHQGARGFGADIDDEHPAVYISWRDAVAWCNAYSEMMGLSPVYYRAGTPHTTGNVYRDAMKDGDIGNSDCEMSADGYRLPTEAEWEYAARYVDGSEYTPGSCYSGYGIIPGGNNATIGDFACYLGNSLNSTIRPGEKMPNYLGLHDMSGNAGEWCWDWYEKYSYRPQTDPMGRSVGERRVIRGGCWTSDTYQCATSCRSSAVPSVAYYFWGMRLCQRD